MEAVHGLPKDVPLDLNPPLLQAATLKAAEAIHCTCGGGFTGLPRHRARRGDVRGVHDGNGGRRDRDGCAFTAWSY